MSAWEWCRHISDMRLDDQANGHLVPGGYMTAIDALLDQILTQRPDLHVEMNDV